MYDTVVIGGGPSGLYSAKLLEKRFKILVIEEHKEIGKPVQCSGLISRNIEDFVKIDKDFVENEVKGAIIHSQKKEIKLMKPDKAAYVIDRKGFDKSLAKGLKSEIMFNTRVMGIDIASEHATVKTNGKEIKTKMILGCDGPNSVVRNHFGVKPRETLKGLIAITSQRNDSDFVELWFDKGSNPDGFFWKIPRGGKTEYGMLSEKSTFNAIEKFFKIKNYEKRAGMIPIGLQKTHFPRTLLVGDSAGQVKPWSGGGVVYGLTCAKIASDVVKKAFDANDFSEAFLEQYETRWIREIGKNINLGLMFREFYKDMDSDGVERFFEKLRNRDMNEFDMDFPVSGFL